jgi:hypothetical protein
VSTAASKEKERKRETASKKIISEKKFKRQAQKRTLHCVLEPPSQTLSALAPKTLDAESWASLREAFPRTQAQEA